MAANLTIIDNDTVIQYTSIGESIFTFPFPFLANDEIKVSVDQVDQTLSVDFNLSGIGLPAGGTVTFVSATTIGEVITIWQAVPIKRLTGFSTGAAALLGEDLNTEFVRQVRVDQEIRRDNRRALRLDIDDPQSGQDMVIPTQTTRAGKVLAFDAGGKPTVLTLVSNEDASLRADLASQAASLGFNLVAITKTSEETGAGATITNPRLVPGNGERYGMDPAATPAVNRQALQDACDSVPVGGGLVFIDKPGTYEFDTITNPYLGGHKACLDITIDGTYLRIGPGVTFKLADGQQTDAGGPVDMIVWDTRNDIKIFGGGAMIGNTAGQSGWTGGYGQQNSGNLIYDTSTAVTELNITVEDLTLSDHFSNPVVIGQGGASGDIQRVLLQNLKGFACGEGFLVNRANGVRIIDVDFNDTANVTVGDGIEISRCTDFLIDRCTVKDNGAGSAFDIFGSKDGVVSNFLVDGWGIALDGKDSGATTTDRVLFSNGVIKNATGAGSAILFPTGRCVFENIRVYDSDDLFQMGDDTGDDVELINFLGDNCENALIFGSRKIIWKGGGNINSKDIGCNINQNSSGETRNLEFSDLDFRGATDGATNGDIRFNDSGFGPMLMVGEMLGIKVSAIDNFNVSGQADLTGMYVSGCSERVQVTAAGFEESPHIEVLRKSANSLVTFASPSKQQTVVVEATGSWNIVDRTQGTGVNIFLEGAVNFAMTDGDRCVLKFNGTNWYEIGRSVT